MHHLGRDEAADEVARDIARDVCGEGSGGIRIGAALAEVGEREAERRRHEHALRHPQRGEDREVRSKSEKHRRDRQKAQTNEDAEAALDAMAIEGHDEASRGHAEGAGVDGQAHRRW